MHSLPPTTNLCPVCSKPYDYSAPGGGKAHDLCWELTALRSDLKWLRETYRRTKIVNDECAKLGASLAEIERSWPPESLVTLAETRTKVNALKLAIKQRNDG